MPNFRKILRAVTWENLSLPTNQQTIRSLTSTDVENSTEFIGPSLRGSKIDIFLMLWVSICKFQDKNWTFYSPHIIIWKVWQKIFLLCVFRTRYNYMGFYFVYFSLGWTKPEWLVWSKKLDQIIKFRHILYLVENLNKPKNTLSMVIPIHKSVPPRKKSSKETKREPHFSEKGRFKRGLLRIFQGKFL